LDKVVSSDGIVGIGNTLRHVGTSLQRQAFLSIPPFEVDTKYGSISLPAFLVEQHLQV